MLFQRLFLTPSNTQVQNIIAFNFSLNIVLAWEYKINSDSLMKQPFEIIIFSDFLHDLTNQLRNRKTFIN